MNMAQIKSNAITWALAREGKAEYASWCLSFIEDAVEVSNGIELFGVTAPRNLPYFMQTACTPANRNPEHSYSTTAAASRPQEKSTIGDTVACVSVTARSSTPGTKSEQTTTLL